MVLQDAGDLEALVTIGVDEGEERSAAKLPPLEVKAEIEEGTYGQFSIGPLERGLRDHPGQSAPPGPPQLHPRRRGYLGPL